MNGSRSQRPNSRNSDLICTVRGIYITVPKPLGSKQNGNKNDNRCDHKIKLQVKGDIEQSTRTFVVQKCSTNQARGVKGVKLVKFRFEMSVDHSLAQRREPASSHTARSLQKFFDSFGLLTKSHWGRETVGH